MGKKKYRLTTYVPIEVKTIVEAESEEEAWKTVLSEEREIMICVHGTDDAEADEEWVWSDSSSAPQRDHTSDIEEI